VKVCPSCRSDLISQRAEQEWFCESCGFTFPTPEEAVEKEVTNVEKNYGPLDDRR